MRLTEQTTEALARELATKKAKDQLAEHTAKLPGSCSPVFRSQVSLPEKIPA
jgi:hypothetical protein